MMTTTDIVMNLSIDLLRGLYKLNYPSDKAKRSEKYMRCKLVQRIKREEAARIIKDGK